MSGMAAAGFQIGRAIARRPFAVAASESSPNSDGDALQAFAAMEPIDTHVHAFKTDPAFTDLMTRLQLHVLDICVADTHGIYGNLATELARAKDFVGANSGHARLCVTLSLIHI